MTIRVNGGIKQEQMLAGSLRHFKITGALLDAGLDIPNAAIEVVYRTIAQKATPVIMNADASALYVCFENGVSGWDAASLQSAIQALGAAVGVDAVDLSASVVTEPGYVLV